ncbi:MAG: type I-E CRISPR-associated endoribonuclease Cas2 [Clostridiales bacterium]|nr:type I-E CRISPR-associated endoribonuclease Cas2 [Clostridiales bacterium]
MIVITLTDCPPSLRGDLTKWFQEVNTGVYVGQVNARVRDELWKRVQENAKTGRATMVYNTNNEQHMDFRVHNTKWEPIDFDGLKLMLHPSPARIKQLSERRLGFSKAAKMRKAKQFTKVKPKTKTLPETYIVVDLETTGLSMVDNEIIEIGAVLVVGRETKSTFQRLIKAKGKIPPSIKALTGITNEILDREGSELSKVLKEFFEFVGDFPVISHNADFDYGFLRSACQSSNIPPFSNRCIDTLALARRLIDDVKDYKLATLLEYFEIDTDGLHRSFRDCLARQQLYEKLIELQESDI